MFRSGADCQREIGGNASVSRQVDSSLFRDAETGMLRHYTIGSRRKRRNNIVALAIRGHLPNQLCAFVPHRNRRSWKHSAGGVLHRSGNAPRNRLAPPWAGEDKSCQEQTHNSWMDLLKM